MWDSSETQKGSEKLYDNYNYRKCNISGPFQQAWAIVNNLSWILSFACIIFQR
jgi:hypothetical protein